MDPSPLTFRTDYWDDPAAKHAFRELVRAVFDLDFTAWEAAGYWDRAYRPFTFFDAQGRAVASVCLYAMDLWIGGVRCTAGQVSGVATRPEWRRRGLARQLVQEALAWSESAGHAFQYLFSDDEARPLYRGAGFVPVDERVTTVEPLSVARRQGARRIDPADPLERDRLFQDACTRAPISRRLSALNERLVMFHVLGALREAVWRIEPLDIHVLARRVGGVLTIFDILGRRIPALHEAYPYLAAPEDSRVVIRFEVDELGDLARLGRVGTEPLCGNNLHVRGRLPLPGPVVFPITAQA